MKGVTNPHHRETVGKLRDQMWSISTLELDALVEVIDRFSEPQANDQERGETCRSSCERGICQERRFNLVPIMKPNKPIQADARWTMGLSS